jgi:hypothetical protein
MQQRLKQRRRRLVMKRLTQNWQRRFSNWTSTGTEAKARKERIETRWRTTCVATEAKTKTNAHEREKNHPD